VNWSAVAAKAFWQELWARKAMRETETMDDAIARLREADKLDGSEAGKRAAHKWVMKQARPKELRRLAAQNLRDWDWEEGVAFHVLEVLWGEGEVDRGMSEEFWKTWLDEEYPKGELLQSFVETAVELWEDLESKL